MQKIALCLMAYLSSLVVNGVVMASPPAMMLAKKYTQDIDVTEYWVSEKLDGVRARWNGVELVSKNGYAFSAPEWFTAGFPTQSLDGELWIARNHYQETSSITRQHQPHNGWRRIKFMLFDLPNHQGMFSERLSAMRSIVKLFPSPYLQLVDQFRVNSHEDLKRRLQQVIDEGGEGLMLHHQSSVYINGRSNRLLKLKPLSDAEATVIGYRSGKGKYKGMLGSVRVRNDQGSVFYIGTGFTLEQRKNPPAISSRITYQYQGLTKNNIPRFPVFMRVRDEL